MIKYAIPGMYELAEVNIVLLDFIKKFPEYFYDDVEVELVYGNPQFCIWDGGRIFGRYVHTTIEELDKLIYNYNVGHNTPIRYVFTSSTLEEAHYHDRFGNLLLDAGSHYDKNSIVLVDDGLLDYIHTNFPNYSFVSSTTKRLNNPELAKAELDNPKFNLVCLDYDLNHNMKFLESLTPEQVTKTEFLINAICPPGCKHRKEHYKLNSLSHLSYGRQYTMENCGVTVNSLHPKMKTGTNNFTYQEIHDVYAPMGFEHFKIEGRTWDKMSAIVTYAEYMVKPEYQSIFIVDMDRAVGDMKRQLY